MDPVFLWFFMVGFAFWFYENVIKTRIEVGFVSINGVSCLNFNNIYNHRCERKYCATKLLLNMIEKIDMAKDSIDIAMYNLTNRELVKSILKARNRNVPVRLIMDKSVLEGLEDRTIASNLKNSGVQIRLAGEEKKLMHHKFCLIDTMNRLTCGTVITGSLNWTYGGFNQNCENVTFIESRKIQTDFNETFNEIWNKVAMPFHTYTSEHAFSGNLRYDNTVNFNGSQIYRR